LAFVLDGIEDPQNVGAVLRVADGAGALGVVIPRTGAAGLTAGAVRASAGAVEHVRVASVDNLPSALVALKKARFRIVGTSAANGPAHSDADLRGAVALVLGSEGRGVSAAVERACDSFVRIPLLGALESLNVSTAAAVLAFEKRRQDGSAAARPGASVPHAGRPPARNREAESSPLESTETGGAAGPVTDSETP
jgi:23S rRNA (guanosine2251-2'-O)-methyltransferase